MFSFLKAPSCFASPICCSPPYIRRYALASPRSHVTPNCICVKMNEKWIQGVKTVLLSRRKTRIWQLHFSVPRVTKYKANTSSASERGLSHSYWIRRNPCGFEQSSCMAKNNLSLSFSCLLYIIKKVSHFSLLLLRSTFPFLHGIKNTSSSIRSTKKGDK